MQPEQAQQVLPRPVRLCALVAGPPDQTLGDREDQGAGDQERVRAHVDETRQRRGGRVGVQGGEDEVAGEGGLERQLGGLRVADLAHQHDVRVLPQHRAEPGLEGHAGLDVDLHLRDPGQLDLDRVLQGDDVLLGVEDLRDAGVEGVRLARPGRTGDQNEALRGVQGAAERLQLVRLEAEHVQARHVVALGEDPDDGLLAVQAGQGGHAGVDPRTGDDDLRPAVLRDAPLGDVETGDDLDPRQHRPGRLAGGDHDVAQDAVDPEADAQAVALGLHVDVRGAELDGLVQDLVDELDRGGVVDAGAADLLGDLLADPRDHLRQAVAAAGQAPDPAELVADLRLDGDDRQHLGAEGQSHVVQRQDVGRVGHGHDVAAVAELLDHHGAAALAHPLRQATHDGRVHGQGRQVEGVQAELLGQGHGYVALVDEPEVDERLTEPAARARGLLGLQGLLQLRVGDDPGVSQQVAESSTPLIGRGPSGQRPAGGVEKAHAFVLGRSGVRL